MPNDTRLHSSSKSFKIDGYCLIRQDKSAADTQRCRYSAGGIAFLVPNNWVVHELPPLIPLNEKLEAKAVILIPPGCSLIKLLSVYNHPGSHVPTTLFTKFKEIRYNNLLVKGFICGDLNSPHKGFGSRFDNEYGVTLLRSINDENMLVLNSDEATYYQSSTGQENILDLVICELESASLMNSCYVEEDIGTDHMPVCLSITPEVIDLSRWESTSIKKEFSRTDIQLFNEIINNEILKIS